MMAAVTAALGLPWGSRVALSALACVAASTWTRFAVGSSPAGAARLLLAAPVLAVFTCAPLLFNATSESLSRASACAMLMWLANFKAGVGDGASGRGLGWAWRRRNRGGRLQQGGGGRRAGRRRQQL